jgi:hypothetical protein
MVEWHKAVGRSYRGLTHVFPPFSAFLLKIIVISKIG